MDTQIFLDHEPVADGGYLVRALLRITGQAPDDAGRPRLDLALVLDRSGSMTGEPLEYAKKAADLVVRRLGARDVVSVVAYDDQVRTLAGRAPASGKDAVRAAVGQLHPGGMTNLSGGWLRGRDLVAAGVDGEGDVVVRRVLLMTDGLANVGITEPDQLAALLAAAAHDGVSTSTIGFGPDYDERLLRTLADAGRGSTHYIEDADQAPAVFGAELEGLMALAAQNVAVTVAPSEAVTVTAVHHQYPSSTTDGGALRLELGDLYALEPRSLLIEFLAGDEAASEALVATLTLEGHVMLAAGGVEKRTLTLPIEVARGAAAVVDPEVRRELILLEAARAREEALEHRARGDFEGGHARLMRMAQKLEDHGELDDQLRDELEDLRDMADRFEAGQVSLADQKYMYHRAARSLMSRMVEGDVVSASRRKRRKSAGEHRRKSTD